MTKQVQRRRGTATQHTSFTGAEGELSVNTTNKSVHVHDNVTAGGFEAARVDMDNVTSSSILTAAGITASTTELNYVDGVTSAIQTQLDGKAGTASPTFTGTLTTANLTATGTTTLAGASTSADITFGDNNKAIFGASSDLQIYHDGTRNYIDSDTTELRLQTSELRMVNSANTEIGLKAVEDGAVTLYYDANPKLATTSTGVDITGTLISDGLKLDAANSEAVIGNNASYQGKIKYNDSLGEFEFRNTYDTTFRGYAFYRGSTDKTSLRLDGNGDISFYEDTGTTPKFFWDASAESLGIGTSSPAFSSGYGGLHVHSTYPEIHLTGLNSGSGVSDGFKIQKNSVNDVYLWNYENALMVFGTNNAEAMRIDASRNLLVGKTSADNGATVGVELRGDISKLYVTDSASSPIIANRLSSDGNIAVFQKNGSTVGNIGTYAGDLTIGDDDIGIRFDTGSGLVPWDLGANSTGGSARDAAIDIGAASARFKDLYLSGGVFLGGTGSSNKLDDYEEGTWTPAWADSAGNDYTGGIYRTGRYSKVGNVVVASFEIRATQSVTSYGLIGTNFILVKNLPFTNNSNNFMGGTISNYHIGTAVGAFTPVIGRSGTTISFRTYQAAAEGTMSVNEFNGGSRYIYGQVTYRTN
jgi:hypothetical protein